MSLVDTLIDPLRSGYSGAMDAQEWRGSNYGALALFQKQSASRQSILTPQDVQNVKNSFGMASPKIPVLDLQDVTIGSVRSCVIQPDVNVSRFIQLTFVSYVFGFTMVPSMYKNNMIGYELDWQKKMQKYLQKLAKVMDTACVGKLNTDRNQVFTGLTAEYPVVGNAFQVGLDQREDVYNQLAGIMSAADFNTGNYDVLANTLHKPLVAKLASNGQQNANNTAYQLAGYNNFYTNSITQNAGVRDTLYLIPENTVALVNRNDPDAVANSRAQSGAQWGTVQAPIVDLEMGTYFYDRCGDATVIFATSDAAGLSRTLVEGYEFSTDVAYVTSYVSDRSAKIAPIQKVEISTT